MLTALSLPLPYLFCLGLLLAIVLPGLLDEGSNLPRRHRAALPALFLAAGILIDYLLVLVIGDLTTASAVGAALAVAGVGRAVAKLRRRVLDLFSFGWMGWLVILYLAILYAVPIFLDPLHAGDARSIWFFHGKMIYYAGGLTAATGLDTAPVLFSHVDYPKLVGVLAAQTAMLAGFWNEFLPKGSLAVLLLPPLLGVASFFRGIRISAIFLVALLFFGAGWHLWNGYMDGYLALYAAVALLFLGRWLDAGSRIDLAAGILFLGVAMNLKNEGLLVALSVAAAMAVRYSGLVIRKQSGGNRGLSGGDQGQGIGDRDSATVALTARDSLVSRVPNHESRITSLLLLPLLCIAAWSVRKSAWGLENDLKLGAGSIPIVARHLHDGAVAMIGRSLLLDALVGKAAIIAAGAAAAAAAFRVRVPAGFWLAVGTGAIYFTGMFCVYLATPVDLQWHLSTSAGRTMMTVLGAMFAGSFLVLKEIEKPGLGTRKLGTGNRENY